MERRSDAVAPWHHSLAFASYPTIGYNAPMFVEQVDILSVGQLTKKVKELLERTIGSVWVAGEISNWKVSPAGHAYFTLKDADSEIAAVIFRNRLSTLKFKPESGLEVVVHGQVTVYEKRGNYQIVCDTMQPKGLGALQLAFERLRAKLAEEGLFDDRHKKPIPLLPRRIGIVTSPSGAAIRDILNVIKRRFANVHILLYPARVQGDEAPPEIVEGIQALERLGVDVMIVGRGGGSLEDLWAFNDERIVRAVFACSVPIISAVGHEIDFTLTDFVADLRAPTPSAAAELVVKEQESLLERVRQCRARLLKATGQSIAKLRNRVALANSCYLMKRPEELVRQPRQRADDLRMRLQAAIETDVAARRRTLDRARHSLLLLSPMAHLHRARERYHHLHQRLEHAVLVTMQRTRARLGPLLAQLDALSPLAILSRGYALTWKLPERTLVRDAKQLTAGDNVVLRFGSGGAHATIDRVDVNERA